MRRKNMKHFFYIVLASCLFLMGTAFAAERNHYPLGFNGINSAIRPINTKIWTQFLNYYHANHLVGPNGKNLPVHGHFNELLTLGVFHWYSDIPILLGGTYGFSIFIPMLGLREHFTSPTTRLVGGGPSFQFGDIHLAPINIAYRWDYLHMYLEYGFYMPTGKFEPFSLSNFGLGCWGHQFTLAATYFFDPEKTFSASAYATYEIHNKVRSIRLYPGDNLCIDWGVGKIIKKTFVVGVAGYAEWQTTKDRGRDVPPNTHGGTDRVYSVGPEIQYLLPNDKGLFRFRYEWEFDVRNRTKGQAAIFLSTLIF